MADNVRHTTVTGVIKSMGLIGRMFLRTSSANKRQYGNSSDVLSSGSVQVWGESLFYETSGRAEDGPTILFLHESGGASSTWHGQLSGLAKSVRCVAPDLPGHGRSEGMGHKTIDGYSQTVLAFLDALAIRWPVVIAGVCQGAAIAVDLALKAPDRVGALVLSGVTEELQACDRTLEAVWNGDMAQPFVESLFGPKVSRRVLMDKMSRWRATGNIVRYQDLKALRDYHLTERLPQVTHPMLLVAGELDRLVQPDRYVQIASSLQNARAVTVGKSGCMSMVEYPYGFNLVVSEFVARICPTQPIDTPLNQRGGYRRYFGGMH
jgi:pimeloyl-ACP methyl ester carboxylesterase